MGSTKMMANSPFRRILVRSMHRASKKAMATVTTVPIRAETREWSTAWPKTGDSTTRRMLSPSM